MLITMFIKLAIAFQIECFCCITLFFVQITCDNFIFLDVYLQFGRYMHRNTWLRAVPITILHIFANFDVLIEFYCIFLPFISYLVT